MIIKMIDLFTGKLNAREIDVTQDQINEWRYGALIQNVMPNLTDSEREFIMTGLPDESWDEAFNKEDSTGK